MFLTFNHHDDFMIMDIKTILLVSGEIHGIPVLHRLDPIIHDE